MDKARIGTFIREQRMVLGLTQQQLADQLHVTNKAISRGERMILPSADTNALLGDVICEARQQKKDRAAKWLRILCLSIFSVILLAFLFFTGAFYFIQNEVNLDDALFTLALGSFVIGILFLRYGIPLLLLGVTLPPLLRRHSRRPSETIICIVLSVLSGVWLLHSISIVLLNLSVH